jgi:hypothetical protein
MLVNRGSWPQFAPLIARAATLTEYLDYSYRLLRVIRFPTARYAMCIYDLYMRQERLRTEQSERDRVLWLIEVRLDIWRALAKRGPEEEQQDAAVALDVLQELEEAVLMGIHQ